MGNMSDLYPEIAKVIGEKAISRAFSEIVFVLDIESHVKGLEDMKIYLEALLLDAKDTTGHVQVLMREKISCTLYQICDFLDGREARSRRIIKFTEKFSLVTKVLLFFSGSNPFISAFRDARQVKVIMEQLDCVKRENHFQLPDTFIGISREKYTESRSPKKICGKIIGRDRERDSILSRLFDSFNSIEQSLSLVCIIGSDGVGKTTLARDLYNDVQVKRHFDLRLWVHVPPVVDMREMIMLILASASRERSLGDGMDQLQLQRQLRRLIMGKKYLLVMNNILDHTFWNQNWQELRTLLEEGGVGSTILMTSCSKKVARLMGVVNPTMLMGLTMEDSWVLLQRVALTCRHENDGGLKEIGKAIAAMCQGVPLVIRVIGGLLREKRTVKEWQEFRDYLLDNVNLQTIDVFQSLRLSYDELDPRLRLCLAHTSLFPKGHWFDEDSLIQLWIAQGYVEETQDEDQSLEDTAKEYLFRLMGRGYFQDVEKDEFGCTKRFGMNDLIHDFVSLIAENLFRMMDGYNYEEHHQFGPSVRHVSLRNIRAEDFPSSLLNMNSQLQSLHVWGKISPSSHVLREGILHQQSLTVLCLQDLGMEEVSSSIGELVHLRYLNLSANNFRELPISIAQKLVNLQSLNSSWCENLTEIPGDFSNLGRLLYLSLDGCWNLRHMPLALGKLKKLRSLDFFIVRNENWSSRTDAAGGLAELKDLNNLQGQLKIIVNGLSNGIVSGLRAANMQRKERLEALHIRFCESSKDHEMVLEALNPPPNLRYLTISNYQGERLPSCLDNDQLNSSLPNLDRFRLEFSSSFEQRCQEPTGQDSPITQYVPHYVNIQIQTWLFFLLCLFFSSFVLFSFLCIFICLFVFVFPEGRRVDKINALVDHLVPT